MPKKSAPLQANKVETNEAATNQLLSPTVTFRKFTEAELRLPMWLRGNRLPRYVAESVEEWFLRDDLPSQLQHLWALIELSNAAEGCIFRVRSEHGASTSNIDPRVFIQNVVLKMCLARDAILKQSPASLVSVVNSRLDKLVETTKASLEALMSESVERILCRRPDCQRGGHHMLPGPWEGSMKRRGEACGEAFLLMSFFHDADPPSPEMADRVAMLEASIVGGGSSPLKNPVLIAKIAAAAGIRGDVLQRSLERRYYPIFGPKGLYEVELEQAIVVLPAKKRPQARKWAKDNGYTSEQL